jgi:MFS family permease
MLITGFMIPFIPLLWLFGTNFWYLVILQLFSGAAWGGFNLAASNFIYDANDSENRARSLAYFNFMVGISTFIGAAFGGLLLKFFRIPVLFAISGIARLAVAILLLPKIKEARLVEINFGNSFFNSISIRPRSGFFFTPFHFEKRRVIIPQSKENKPKNVDKIQQETVERLVHNVKETLAEEKYEQIRKKLKIKP